MATPTTPDAGEIIWINDADLRALAAPSMGEFLTDREILALLAAEADDEDED